MQIFFLFLIYAKKPNKKTKPNKKQQQQQEQQNTKQNKTNNKQKTKTVPMVEYKVHQFLKYFFDVTWVKCLALKTGVQQVTVVENAEKNVRLINQRFKWDILLQWLLGKDGEYQ